MLCCAGGTRVLRGYPGLCQGEDDNGYDTRMVSLQRGLKSGVRGSTVFEVECDGGSIGCKEATILFKKGGERGKSMGLYGWVVEERVILGTTS